jgi:hypothetical protein
VASADPLEELQRDVRSRRRRLVLFFVGLPIAIAIAACVYATLRPRTVSIIGGPETAQGRLDGTRFRITAPYMLTFSLMPGTQPITEGQGPIRSEIAVPFAPWVSRIAVPAQPDQCLIVADASAFYEGVPHTVFIHSFTTESEPVALPPLFSDIVVNDPCHLPRFIRVADTIAVILSVPCDGAPRDSEDARRRVIERARRCDGASVR